MAVPTLVWMHTHALALTFPDRPPLTLDQPRVMGILNATPDSFSDGGRFGGLEAAVAQGLAMAAQGASIIDVGGESTRPGAERLPAEAQNQRVVELIRRLRAALDEQFPQVLLSIDTTLSAVAEPAVAAGARLLNDISAGRDDPQMLHLAATRGLPIVLMHMQGQPATMQDNPVYGDVVAEVEAFLLERAAAARLAGVPGSQIVLDPGIGFGKTAEHNRQLLAHLPRLVRQLGAAGCPVLLGVSRKGFIRQLSPATTRTATDRVGGTCAVTALAVAAGVPLHRVHDVRENLQAAQVAFAVAGGEASGRVAE